MFDYLEKQYFYRNMSFGVRVRRFWSMKSKFMFSENRKMDRQLQEMNMRVLDDDWITNSEGFELFENSFLWEPMEKLILECHQHGIIEYLIKKNIAEPLKAQLDSNPKILTLYILSAGFTIWLASISIACLVFLAEIIYNTLREKEKLKRQSELEIFGADRQQSKNKCQNVASVVWKIALFLIFLLFCAMFKYFLYDSDLRKNEYVNREEKGDFPKFVTLD